MHVWSRKEIVCNNFHSIHIGLSQIGSARRGDSALNAPLPNHNAVVDTNNFKIGQNSYESLRFSFPPADLADEDQAGKLSLASHPNRSIGIGGQRRKPSVSFLGKCNAIALLFKLLSHTVTQQIRD